MSLLAALSTGWHAVSTTERAWAALQAGLAAGDTPIALLRRVAAATEGKLDDQALAVLEDGVRKAVGGLLATSHAVGAVALWITKHEGDIAARVKTVAAHAGDVSYHARGVAAVLETWLADAERPTPRA